MAEDWERVPDPEAWRRMGLSFAEATAAFTAFAEALRRANAARWHRTTRPSLRAAVRRAVRRGRR